MTSNFRLNEFNQTQSQPLGQTLTCQTLDECINVPVVILPIEKLSHRASVVYVNFSCPSGVFKLKLQTSSYMQSNSSFESVLRSFQLLIAVGLSCKLDLDLDQRGFCLTNTLAPSFDGERKSKCHVQKNIQKKSIAIIENVLPANLLFVLNIIYQQLFAPHGDFKCQMRSSSK